MSRRRYNHRTGDALSEIGAALALLAVVAVVAFVGYYLWEPLRSHLHG